MVYHSINLQLLIEPLDSSNHYRASVKENGKIKAREIFELSHDPILTRMLARIEEKAIINYPQPRGTTHIKFGKMLYNAVFF